MWESHLLKPSWQTPICRLSSSCISNRSILCSPVSSSSVQRLVLYIYVCIHIYLCVCVCDWAKFSAPVFQPVRSARCCSSVKQTRLKSAGGRVQARVLNYNVGAHRADISFIIIVLMEEVVRVHVWHLYREQSQTICRSLITFKHAWTKTC